MAENRTLALALVLALAACSDDTTPGADAAVPDSAAADSAVIDLAAPDAATPDAPAIPAGCAAGAKDGPQGKSDGLTTAGARLFNLRTPASYDPTRAHPLLVVYAAAGGTPANMEPFTGLTPDATAAGYIVAYVDHVSPNNSSGVTDIAQVPDVIAKRWCVDRARVYLTGHSDGGSVIYVMLARKAMNTLPAAIAPSAAGLSSKTFASVPCLSPAMPAMVLHSKNDGLFPGFGAHARDWWVKCNGCSATGQQQADGCLAYPGCSAGAQAQYCETAGSHGSWPKLNSSMLAFFKRFSRAQQ